MLRAWNEAIYPRLASAGALIALVHVNVGTLTLDEQFALKLDASNSGGNAAEMLFLNGDSKSDVFS